LITKIAENSTISQTQSLLKIPKGATIDDRNAIVIDPKPSNLTKPGLSFMKQVHLYTKWRPLLPVELQDVTCPKPSEDVVNKCKSSLKQKRQLKEALIYDGIEEGDDRTLTKRTRSGTKKVTRKRMRLLTDNILHGDDDNNTSLITNVEYAAGSDNLFTQPPPPTIAGDVESLADDVGNNVYESNSDHNNNDHNVRIPTEDTDHERINDDDININKSTHLVHDVTTNNVDIGKEDAEATKDDNVANKMDKIILTDQSFLQFVEVDYDENVESSAESLVNIGTEVVVGKDTIGSNASTSREGPTNTEIDNNRVEGSTRKRYDDASIKVVSARDSKLGAVKKVATTKNTKNTKLKLPKKGKKQKEDTTNKPSRQTSRSRLLRSDVPKTTLQSRQVSKNV